MQLIANLENFLALKNQPFEVVFANGVVKAELREVTTRGKDPTATRDLFSLYFHTGPVGVMPQGTYLMRHAGQGECDIFLVPIAGDADGVTYEAVFS